MRLHAARWLDASQAAALIAPLYHAQRGLHDAKYCFEVIYDDSFFSLYS
jgi:hypothetical protein